MALFSMTRSSATIGTKIVLSACSALRVGLSKSWELATQECALRGGRYTKRCVEQSLSPLHATRPSYPSLPQNSELPGFGLSYDPKTKEWMDNAADWLDDGLSGEQLHNHLRSTCPSGIAYNKLLLDNPMDASLPVQPLIKVHSPSPVLPTPGPSQ